MSLVTEVPRAWGAGVQQLAGLGVRILGYTLEPIASFTHKCLFSIHNVPGPV